LEKHKTAPQGTARVRASLLRAALRANRKLLEVQKLFAERRSNVHKRPKIRRRFSFLQRKEVLERGTQGPFLQKHHKFLEGIETQKHGTRLVY